LQEYICQLLDDQNSTTIKAFGGSMYVNTMTTIYICTIKLGNNLWCSD